MPLNIVAFVLSSLGFMQSVEALICAAGFGNHLPSDLVCRGKWRWLAMMPGLIDIAA